ncbi:CaiB/BaiF CoA transferase family protein [Sabulicella glaciei]|uniref:CoA transferase n=1 Tax=Sabulicella glaciei TaxID=2984948 RepID=A0ABT3NZG9_9PROT|nr:CoA transferase [Roseococcus sp. MDT2-1-1]MCW8087565.1 CoA transferase [Roseococcus sp. MDT2-1-1]
MTRPAHPPLQGIRVLDISTIIAGPWSATLLADLGAEVLKVELPGRGDGLRALPPFKDGVPLWWKVTNRNKRGVTMDLRTPDGAALLERLLPKYDVLVENFRPGTMDRWGLTAERLFAANPRLVVLRVTGFGQTGPYRNRPGFARVFEAMSGFASICGEADGPPLHAGFPIADAVGGLFGAMGILAALRRRDADPDLGGQEIDLSMLEAMLRVLDFLPAEYDQLGVVRGRHGNTSQHGAPGNVYRTRDGRWVSLPATTQTVFERLCAAIDRPDLIADPRFLSNPERVRHRVALDAIVAKALATRDLSDWSETMDAHAVAFAPIYDIADVFADPHLAEREAIISVPDEQLGTLRMQGVVPHFPDAPGAVHRAGPEVGQHNAEVFGGELGLSEEEMARLKAAGAI